MKPTSTLLENAIAFAKSYPRMAAMLQGRDNARQLYLAGISCRIQTYSDSNDWYIRIIFDYQFLPNHSGPQPDCYLDLQVRSDGTFSVLPPPNELKFDN